MTELATFNKASALFASRQFVVGRAAMSTMIALSALVAGARLWPSFWLAIMVASLVAQYLLSRNKDAHTGRTQTLIIASRAFLSFVDTSMYALAAALISADGGSATPFAVTILMLTMLYVMMHFYMQPRLVLVLNAPCFIALMDCLLGPGDPRVIIWREPLRLYLPIAATLFASYFFMGARRALARARRALVESRSEAVQRASEAIAASQAKSEFLATMSHEIRTPLNGVLGIAQVMEADELSERQRERLRVIRHSGETLTVILNDLLDFSKIEAGKLQLEDIAFSLDEVVQGVHATFSAAASAKELAFHLVISEDARGGYRGDPSRLRQILYNLVSNALKFTQKGEVLVDVSRTAGQLRIEVSDTGIGIPLERQARLFDKFVQADASTTREYGGTGLGLAIASQLVAHMQGTLTLKSVPGRCATFTLLLPLLKELGFRTASANAPQATPAEGVRDGLRVLVAEDNATNQLVIRLMLNQIGVQPVIVETGLAAVEAWTGGSWDLVLMDVQMPVMDGVTATRDIRRRERETGRERTPILALTANAMTNQRSDYMASGMDGMVSKPITASELFGAIETALTDLSQAA